MNYQNALSGQYHSVLNETPEAINYHSTTAEMWRRSVFFCLFVILVEIEAIGFRGFHYRGLEEPAVKSSRLLGEKWIEQPLDHFDVRNNRTWLMRFYENEQFFNGNGPIFIMLGGEWAISSGYLQTGILFENAKVHGAMMYYTEHRYYGKSHPVPDTSSENLVYLSVDQALADVAFFIETKKRELNIPNSPVIVFGGSYAGNMAAWIRIKYPHLIQGALASSAPVRAKADFFEYFEVVTNSLKTYDEKCVSNVKEAISAVETLLIGANPNPEKIKRDFNLCDVPDTTQSTDLALVMDALAEMFAGVVQYNTVENNGQTSIGNLCDLLIANSPNRTAYDRLAAVFRFKYPGNCNVLNYQKFVDIYRNTSWNSEAARSVMRLWYYQTCTEYGYYQTSSSSNSIFGSLFPLEYFVRMCKDLYGEYYNTDIVHDSVRRTNIMYGANIPDVKNVIFTNGDVDPWHALSVLSDLNEHSPAILIEGSSHCKDLQPDSQTDVEGLKTARQKIAKKIAQWLKE